MTITFLIIAIIFLAVSLIISLNILWKEIKILQNENMNLKQASEIRISDSIHNLKVANGDILLNKSKIHSLESDIKQKDNIHKQAMEKHIILINKYSSQIAYYKRKYLSLELSIRENFGKNKPVLNLLKEDCKKFESKKLKDLVNLNTKNNLQKKEK